MLLGLEFHETAALLDERSYSLWSRDLLDTLMSLLDRVGKFLEIPSLVDDDAEISGMWQAGAYQRHLRKFVAVGGNLETDFVLPITFFSGMLPGNH